jgi:putative copper export protein/mono/diheme cytochrome c family protein
MDALLIVARAVHFAAAISLFGTFVFDCFVAAPIFRKADADTTALHRRLWLLAWAGLVLLTVSGAGWLMAIAADMSGKPLVAMLSGHALGVVLTDTRFGEDWLLRLGAAAGLSGLLITAPPARRRTVAALRCAELVIGLFLLLSLAWAGHGAATAGAPGALHLAGDILHLLGAGAWLGTLPPFVLLLQLARRHDGSIPSSLIQAVTRRLSRIAVIGVAVLLAGGMVNTWFLAGTVPALVGTEYGRLLLAKIGLFIAMLVVAAVNLLRLSPRLAPADAPHAAGQLGRNALVEIGLGLAVVAIVAVIGILPPGLHTEPGWPFPYRLDVSALSGGAALAAIGAFALAALGVISAVAAAAAARYRVAAWLGSAVALCAIAGALPLGAAIEPAYPTSFYAPAEPYAADSVVRGGAIYADNCAPCHGATGAGNGPAAAGLPVRPADLTEPHLFAHAPGDLFWWVSQGKGGVMPGFAEVLIPARRWDVINFVLARAAGDQVRRLGQHVSAAAGYPLPDFAFERGGRQDTLRGALAGGPVLLVLCGRNPPPARLGQLMAARARLVAGGLQVLTVSLDEPEGRAADDLCHSIRISAEVRATLSLFRGPDDGGETELMLDRNGDVRAHWTARQPSVPPDSGTLLAEAARAARFAAAAPSHAAHAE